MKFSKVILASLIGLALSAPGVSPAAQATAPMTRSNGAVVRSFEVPRGSTDYERVRSWLADSVAHSSSRVGSPANLDNLGDTIYVKVTQSAQVSSSNGMTAMGGPVFPSPPWTPGYSGYNLGDRATVSVTNGGWTQTWSMMLVRGATGPQWVTVEYRALEQLPKEVGNDS